MKTLKMSLENIQGKMSRKEMRNIMAGSGGGSSCYNWSGAYCGANLNSPCTKTDGSSGKCGVRQAETQCRCL